MASIKEATKNAVEFARETLGVERIRGVQLEEIESAVVNGVAVWIITLSMLTPEPPVDALSSLLGGARREFKSFTGAKDTGEVTSMKIRALADA